MPAGRLAVVAGFLFACALAHAQVQPVPAAPRFDIERFVVEGNTLLPQEAVERILAPYAGKSRDFGSVQQALEALQEAYLDEGYAAVRVLIPEQELRGGEVRLQVIEARLRNVRVERNRFFDEANIRRSMPSLAPGESPNTSRIGRNAQLANENPARQVSVLLESTPEPARVDATMRVTDHDPSRVTVFADNTGNSQTGQLRAGLGYQNANVGNLDQVFTLQVITSPTQAEDVVIAGVGYRIPVYEHNAAFDFFAGYSDVDSGTIQDLFTVSGSGVIAGARFTQILPRIRTFEHKLAFGLDYRRFEQNVAFVGTTTTLVPDIAITPVSVTYTARQSRVGSDLTGYIGLARNIPGAKDGDQEDFTAQRLGAEAKYTILRFGASYAREWGGWLTRLLFTAQLTDDLLIPGEQFGMGGADSVRGFQEREAANDRGGRFTAELYAPDFGERIAAGWRMRPLVFLDAARGRDNEPVRSVDSSLGSVGIGLRVTRGRSLFARVDWGYVVDGTVNRADGNDRFHLALGYAF